MEETKICGACKNELPISEFYFRKDNNTYRIACKKCKRVNTVDQIQAKAKSDTKVCKHCGIEKPSCEYNKAGGGKWLQPYCKPCDAERKIKYVANNKEKVVEKRKDYYQSNKDIINERNKKYAEKNIDIVKERRERYRQKNIDLIRKNGREYTKKNSEILKLKHKQRYYGNHEKYLAQQKVVRDNRTKEEIEAKKKYDREYKAKNPDKYKKWREDNKDIIREQKRVWSNNKSATDINYRIKRNIRTRIRCALKPNNAYKVDTSEKLLGCSISHFREHFSSLFTEGMSWDKFLLGEIEIDHVKPCKLFDLTKEENQYTCFNYKNTQPLWVKDNLKKGAKTMEEWKQMTA